MTRILQRASFWVALFVILVAFFHLLIPEVGA